MCLPPSSCDMVSSFRKPSGQEDGRSQGKREMGPELAVRLLPEAWKQGEEGGNHWSLLSPRMGRLGPFPHRAEASPASGVSAQQPPSPGPWRAGGQLPVGCAEERNVSCRVPSLSHGPWGPWPWQTGHTGPLLPARGHRPPSEAAEARGGCAGLGSHTQLTCPTAWPHPA